MKIKYLIDATVRINLEQVPVYLDAPAVNEDEYEDAIMQICAKRLVLLDIKGGRTGDDGLLTAMEIESIDCWERE